MDKLASKKWLFERGGALLLIRLSEKDMSFNELKTAMKLSPNTVLSRLREATRIGIVEEKLVKTEKRSLIKYTLTKEGRAFFDDLRDFKKHFIIVNEELDKIKEEEKKKEAQLNEVLSSLQKSSSNINIENSKLAAKGDINVKSEISSGSEIETNKKRKRK